MKRILILIAAMGMLGFPIAKGGNRADQEVKGKARPGQALVYIIRQFGGPEREVYCDDQLAAKTHKNTYTIVYLTPGTRIVSIKFAGAEPFDFAAGQKYFVEYLDSGRFVMLSAAEGQNVIAQPKMKYIEASDEDRSKAAETIAKKWPKCKADVESKYPILKESVAYTPPATTENMLKVPAGTIIDAELMENLNSGINQVNDAVWVRALEDVRVDGRLFVIKGTPIKAVIRGAKERGYLRSGGKLDLTMISLMAADGTVCPLIGQLETIGAQGSTAAANVVAAVSLGGGLGANALTRGADTYHLVGKKMQAFTRQDIWIKPLEAMSEARSTAAKPSVSVKSYARGEIACNFRKGEIPKLVEIVFEGVPDIASLEMFQVAGDNIPVPVQPSRLSRISEGWIAQFEGWAIARFLSAGGEGNQLAFRLKAENGDITIAQAKVTIIVPK